MKRRLSCIFFVLALAVPVYAKSRPYEKYAGLEFFAAGEINKADIERCLSLKPGARIEQMRRAADRLNKMLDAKRLDANIEFISEPPGSLYLVVDIKHQANEPPYRRLVNPQHIDCPSTKPFMLLDQLNARLDELKHQERPAKEIYKNGVRYYTDVVLNQIVDELVRYMPPWRQDFLQIVASDPDPKRRAYSVELMNWAGDTADTVNALIPAVDDPDQIVRDTTARYIYSRLPDLPTDFNFEPLIEAFSRMLYRPSYQDRRQALYCLEFFFKLHREMEDVIKQDAQDRVAELAGNSIIPAFKTNCQDLLQDLQKKYIPFKKEN